VSVILGSMQIEKILVVDDDHVIRSSIVNLLMVEWPDCEVITAPNGRVGLNIAKAECPDIVLLDWEMPKMNGLEMLKALRSDADTKYIPVIMNTGIRTEAGDLKLAMEEGADEFLRKPVEPMELIARIRSIYYRIRYFHDKLKREEEEGRMKLEAHKRELDLKRNELTSFALILEQKDLFLRSILREVDDGLQDPTGGADSQKRLQRVSRLLKQELKSDKNWDVIKVRMNSIHSDFLARLVSKHPDLTKNELRLCALMKLNLSRKETANILHISVSGVEKQRYRLRKKLNLEPSQKMENYIHLLTSSEKL